MTPATPNIYTLSLHDALPIFLSCPAASLRSGCPEQQRAIERRGLPRHPVRGPVQRLDDEEVHDVRWRAVDRKSTRLNSSHLGISYAVFCLKKKKKTHETTNLV